MIEEIHKKMLLFAHKFMPLKHQHSSQGKRWLGGKKFVYPGATHPPYTNFLSQRLTDYVSAEVLLKFIQRAFI